MQLKAALASAVSRLTAESVPSPRMNAELLLMFTLDRDRAYLYAHPESELTRDEQARYDAVLNERARGVPAQYITGHQEFWGMDLIVSPAVLIPRPETEHVIESALEVLSPDCGTQASAAHHTSAGVRSPRSVGRPLRIADIGTGSGCIALALAKELPKAQIHASDISFPALEIARANAGRYGLEDRIKFHQTNLLEGLGGGFNLVVSNPPYVGESEADEVQLEVRKFEPKQAVFAGPSGTETIARLIPQARAALQTGGWLIIEISGTIASEVERLLSDWREVRIVPDLQSIPRVAIARKPI